MSTATDRTLSNLLREELRLRESAARIAADLDRATALTAQANDLERRAAELVAREAKSAPAD